MMPPTPNVPIEALRAAARRPEVVAALRRFYLKADRRIAEKNATCWNRGQCCQFGQFGHRLYVTALEVVYYLAEAPRQDPGVTPSASSVVDVPPITQDACPHAFAGKCHARTRRPLGCRIFYCDPNTQAWQGPLTETLLAELRGLHESLAVPYFYADWLTVLRSLA